MKNFNQLKIWKGLKILAIVLLVVFSVSIVHADSQESAKKVNVTVKLTTSGVPSTGTSLFAVSYQTADENITKGTYSKDIIDSSSWTSTQNPTGNIQVANYQLGNGVTHSQSEAIAIISELFKTNFTLLQTINETNSGIAGTFTTPPNFIQMSTPGAAKKQYTNSQGLAEATIGKGLVAIVGSNQNLLDLIEVDGNTKPVAIDTSNGQGLSLSITNLKDYQTSPSQYTISYGQDIEYQINLKKELLTPNGNTLVTLKPDSNLVIDSAAIGTTNLDLSESTLIPPIITAPIQFDPNASAEQLQQISAQIGDTYIPQKLNAYNINVPDTGNDVEVTVHAHISPSVTMSRTVMQNGQTAASPNGKNLDIPINAFDSHDYNFNLAVSAYPATGEVDASAPTVNTSGINFVEADATKNKMITGATYALGKKVNGQILFYSSSNTWQSVSNLTDIDTASYLPLTGGNVYVIGYSQAQTIPVTTSRFNYNFNTNTKINQSLIKIFGLAQEKDYFLYQVKAPQDYQADKNPIDFSVFRNYGATANGNPMTKSSVSTAKNQSFKLNGIIPDYVTGQNEYNLLSVSNQKTIPMSKTKIIIPIVIIVVLIAIIGLILIKVV